MDTLKRLHEHISALADGELTGQEAQQAVAALGNPDARAAWRAYHLIGDVLRSDASGAELGEGFNARLAARLAVEVPPSPGRAAPAAHAALSPAPPSCLPSSPPASPQAAPAAASATSSTAAPAAAASSPVPDTAV
jgi:sigma-E factor negative regulatory protein RseA